MTASNRRRFLKVLGAAAAGSSGVIACASSDSIATGASSASSSTTGQASSAAGGGEPTPVGPPGSTFCGNVSGLPEGALIGLRFKQLVIARDAAGVYAMTSICTHEQCNMLADGGIEPGRIVCGCHQTFFDAVGEVIKGPAKLPLDHYATVLDESGNIFVTIGEVVDPSTRAAV